MSSTFPSLGFEPLDVHVATIAASDTGKFAARPGELIAVADPDDDTAAFLYVVVQLRPGAVANAGIAASALVRACSWLRHIRALHATITVPADLADAAALAVRGSRIADAERTPDISIVVGEPNLAPLSTGVEPLALETAS